MSRNFVAIGGFSESLIVMEPTVEAAIATGLFTDGAAMTAAEYRRTPLSDAAAAETCFGTHSAGIIALAESFYSDPRKYRNSSVAAYNGVEPTKLLRQGLGALKVAGEKIELEEELPDGITSMRHPARELEKHLATTQWIPRRVRKFSTAKFLGTTLGNSDAFSGGRAALWSDADSFGFTPDDSVLEELRQTGVGVGIFTGPHNRILFQSRQVLEETRPFIDTL